MPQQEPLHEIFTSHVSYSGNTISGYDKSTGTDSICWLSSLDESNVSQETFLMQECYPDISVDVSVLSGLAPTEIDQYKVTKQLNEGKYIIRAKYDFHVQFRMNSNSSDNNLMFSGDNFAISWNESSLRPRLRLLLCDNKEVGFCSMNALTLNDDQENNVSNSFVTEFVEMDWVEDNVYDGVIRTSIDQPGSYTAVGLVELTGNVTEISSNDMLFPIQFDASNTIYQKSITVSPEPYIYDISLKATILTVGITIITCVILSFFLFQTIRHRNSNVMKLSQWPFIMVFLICCLVANISSLSVFELNAEGCKIYPVIVSLCHGLLYSTLVARVWRVYQLVSPLLGQEGGREHRMRVFGFFERLVNWENCFEKKENSGSINLRITDQDMGRLIFMLFCPMFFVTLLSRTHDRDGNKILLDEEFEEGVIVCEHTSSDGQYIVLFFYLMYQLLLLYVAYLSKDLPSFLNETSAIFRLTWTNCLVSWITGMILFINLEYVGTPDLNYLCWVSAAVFINVNTAVHIMVPKLRRIWRGEVIVANDLLAEYRSKKEGRDNEQNSEISNNAIGEASPDEVDSYGQTDEQDSHDRIPSHDIYKSTSRLIIRETKPVPRRVLTQLLNANEIMKKVISRSMYGKLVTQQDWEQLKQRCIGLGEEMQLLIFSWQYCSIEDMPEDCVSDARISDLKMPESSIFSSNVLSKNTPEQNDVENQHEEVTQESKQ